MILVKPWVSHRCGDTGMNAIREMKQHRNSHSDSFQHWSYNEYAHDRAVIGTVSYRNLQSLDAMYKRRDSWGKEVSRIIWRHLRIMKQDVMGVRRK